MAQILDVLFQALDLRALAASLRLHFVSARHHITSSIACANRRFAALILSVPPSR